MFFIENFKLALSSLRANKMRAFLTMLGIIIGISSVITIMAIGESVKATVGNAFEQFGKNGISIQPKNWDMKSQDFLRETDIQNIRNAFSKEILYMSPVVQSGGKVTKRKNTDQVSIMGVNEEYKNMEKVNIIKGRFLNKSDILGKREVIVVDKKLALKLYKRSNIIGETLKIDDGGLGQTYVVVGIYEKKPTIFDKLNGAFGYDRTTAYAPITKVQMEPSYSYVSAVIVDSPDKTIIPKRIENYIAKIKHKSDLYKVETNQSQMSQLDGILSKLSIGISAIAFISLLVGGIGVMNIMLVSVTERTREIGVRKALGATRKDILLQFLVESMIVSATGGIIGTSIGLAISNTIALTMGFSATVPIGLIITAVGFSATVGIFFGIYPANKAAKLDPIEALRYE